MVYIDGHDWFRIQKTKDEVEIVFQGKEWRVAPLTRKGPGFKVGWED